MRILCATDLLPRSDAAIERSALLAADLHAELSLLHVVAPVTAEHVLEQELELAISQLSSRARAPAWQHERTPNVAVRAGNPARVIIETAFHANASFVVLGGHRRRGLRDTLEGTIAEKVLSSRTCPVLIVRRKPRRSYNNIMLAVDDSDASRCAIRVTEALGLTESPGQVSVVHAYEPPYGGMLQYAGIETASVDAYAAAWAREYRSAVADVLTAVSNDPRRYDIVLEEGKAAPAILRRVNSLEPDLLILGTRGGGRIRRAFLGSVANEVLHQARCDVLVIPRGVDVDRISRTNPRVGKAATSTRRGLESRHA